jgi:hypothetical protein
MEWRKQKTLWPEIVAHLLRLVEEGAVFEDLDFDSGRVRHRGRL